MLFVSPVQAEVTVTSSATNGTVVDATTYEDGVDGPTVGHFYYLNKTSEKGAKELNLTITGKGLIAGAAYAVPMRLHFLVPIESTLPLISGPSKGPLIP